jgi:hypothetical protein
MRGEQMNDIKYFLTIFFLFMVVVGFAIAFTDLPSSSAEPIISQVFIGTIIGFLGFQGLLLQYYLSQKNK